MMQVKILGTGCAKCRKLEALVRQAQQMAGLELELEKVTDPDAIIEYGVMFTPALVVNGEVKLAGRLPTQNELQRLLTA